MLVDERDAVLAENIRKQKGKVVAIVGMAHVDGIAAAFGEPSKA